MGDFAKTGKAPQDTHPLRGLISLDDSYFMAEEPVKLLLSKNLFAFSGAGEIVMLVLLDVKSLFA